MTEATLHMPIRDGKLEGYQSILMTEAALHRPIRDGKGY